jgi:hypothetical protein
MRPVSSLRRAIVLAAALAGLATPVAAAASQPHSVVCETLKATPALKRSLLRTHLARLKADKAPYTATNGPHGRVYYGRCRTSYYALAAFGHKLPDSAMFDQTDQPERFTRRAGGKWHDRGDTGGDLCGAAPVALVALWGQECGG